MQQQDNYFDYIFQIVGENLKPNPLKLFETPQVYLFIDKPFLFTAEYYGFAFWRADFVFYNTRPEQ